MSLHFLLFLLLQGDAGAAIDFAQQRLAPSVKECVSSRTQQQRYEQLMQQNHMDFCGWHVPAVAAAASFAAAVGGSNGSLGF